jgi:hypothetical protein
MSRYLEKALTVPNALHYLNGCYASLSYVYSIIGKTDLALENMSQEYIFGQHMFSEVPHALSDAMKAGVDENVLKGIFGLVVGGHRKWFVN